MSENHDYHPQAHEEVKETPLEVHFSQAWVQVERNVFQRMTIDGRKWMTLKPHWRTNLNRLFAENTLQYCKLFQNQSQPPHLSIRHNASTPLRKQTTSSNDFPSTAHFKNTTIICSTVASMLQSQFNKMPGHT